MSDKLNAVFSSRVDAEKVSPLQADPNSKKKLYCVTLPSIEQYTAHVNTHGLVMWGWADGYASHAYTAIRLCGGEVSVAPKDTKAAQAAIDAANAAKVAAEQAAIAAAAQLESTKQLLAQMQAEMQAMKAAQEQQSKPEPRTRRAS